MGFTYAGELVAREDAYGIHHFDDHPDALDYDPWEHAEMLDVRVVTNDTLPNPRMVAAYSRRYDAIFVRSGLHGDVERCGVAHELVHYEYRDVGTTPSQERRADRIAARRLIRPSRAAEIFTLYSDPAEVARQLHVTERIMKNWIRHYG